MRLAEAAIFEHAFKLGRQIAIEKLANTTKRHNRARAILSALYLFAQ